MLYPRKLRHVCTFFDSYSATSGRYNTGHKYLMHAMAQTMFNPNILKNGYKLSARPTHTDAYIRPQECTYANPHIIYLFIYLVLLI